MKSPEEMLELSERVTEGPWSVFGGDDDEPNYIWSEPNAAVVADELIKEDAQFIAASREFVPYAAKRLMEAKRLLNLARIELIWSTICLEDESYTQDAEDARKIVSQIQNFLEANK